ncbi:hypothetical protein O8413_20755 [Vibrio furnissii]|uniref:hypothetical protein n=1 Tax=Vibrio furnissii TaxID=29494 RepID=UPI0024BA06A2|nr:hypothetical protein [Vibrio furnissii]WHR53209.1 hypothetical protein O8413_20755 [Vibrio furnissii]
MTTIQPGKTKELVINWHLTEVCNYGCKYCFAKWGRPNELHRYRQKVATLLDNLADYFIKGTLICTSKTGHLAKRHIAVQS